MSQARRVTLVHDQSDFAEARAAEKAESARLGALAARAVASHSTDADDCVRLLTMLGLDAQAGRDSLVD
ncbi:hypothetical protein NDR87_09250 [Nocardia sp. CDC159]|uniref:Uncharacterized protein n=1 Tax=Nocardia pulmonis TaxID=2951408 RepID=A0A9X2E3Q3_9NOCA|nr:MULTISPECIES: hypothetical protein [Nocardia]MCM6773654.1 hypothetical protein [Nocardia pulmonis]MCM6786541.1 hypothetical protein [Nocardia sp. CDC159]